jgi:fucose 4-O-acetylase-like acetyltransferase
MKSVMLFFREPYSKENRLESVFLRMLIYVVAISMIIALINLISNKKSFLSKIGSNTMTVYILHLFTIPILKEYQILYNSPYLYLIYSIAATALIVFIYSRQIVKQAYDRVMGMFVGLILRK